MTVPLIFRKCSKIFHTCSMMLTSFHQLLLMSLSFSSMFEVFLNFHKFSHIISSNFPAMFTGVPWIFMFHDLMTFQDFPGFSDFPMIFLRFSYDFPGFFYDFPGFSYDFP